MRAAGTDGGARENRRIATARGGVRILSMKPPRSSRRRSALKTLLRINHWPSPNGLVPRGPSVCLFSCFTPSAYRFAAVAAEVQKAGAGDDEIAFFVRRAKANSAGRALAEEQGAKPESVNRRAQSADTISSRVLSVNSRRAARKTLRALGAGLPRSRGTRVGRALELKLLEVEVGVGHVNLHLVGFTLRVEREGDEAARERIDDGVAPLDAEGVEVPEFEVADEVGRGREPDAEVAVLLRHFRVAVHRAGVRARVRRERQRRLRVRGDGEERVLVNGVGLAQLAHAVAFGEDDAVVLHNRHRESGHFPFLAGTGCVLVNLFEPL